MSFCSAVRASTHRGATLGTTITGLRLAALDDADGFTAVHRAWLQPAQA